IRDTAISRHQNERGAQYDADRLLVTQRPKRTLYQIQRPRRARPEEARQLILGAGRGTAIGALGAPRIRLRSPLPAPGVRRRSGDRKRDIPNSPRAPYSSG